MSDPNPEPPTETPAHDDDLDTEQLSDELDTDPETPAHPEGDEVAEEDEDPE
ncbi:hypothetical protein [Nocardioides sp. Soil805]|uniref:hypothetical protein n=1 Tax=Nocardioides sp. Soil805 TaxID=1736416 RepID=UPI000A72F008|nr:hypothetical protein [Nocardioides sp. Soil805]